MLHLTAERLAALADEPPTEIESAHLSACPRCCRERDAQLRLREIARAELARPILPLSTWAGIETALRDGAAARSLDARRSAPRAPATTPAGRASRAGRRSVFPSPVFAHRARQLAAASALLAAGLATGRYSAGAAPLGFGARPALDTVYVAAASPADDLTDSMPPFANADEAVSALARAERHYQLAASFLAAHDTAGQSPEDAPAMYRARLAALDEVMAATRTALQEAPQDPVINRYYLATLGARELAVRQLNTALPPGQSVSRF